MGFGKQFAAIANLGVQFWIHLLKKPFVSRKSRGPARYERNYRADHLVAFTPEEYDRIVIYDRCINCGLCDAACVQAKLTGTGMWVPEGGKETEPICFQPSLIPIDISRAQPLFHKGIEAASKFEKCKECRKCELACPNAVPILELARLVLARASIPERSVQKCA